MSATETAAVPAGRLNALASGDLYPAVLEMFAGAPNGRILDVPAGQGAFAEELLQRGYDSIWCLDISAEAFGLADPRVRFQQHDVIHPLPFPDNHFDHVFCVEGLEHFHNPFVFVGELCRVLKPGGRIYLTTPNTLSVDARLKYLLSGYFPRFRPLAKDPAKVMVTPVDDAHVSPIYYWQLNFFLLQAGVSITRVSTNAVVRKGRWINRLAENLVAAIIRRNIRRRGFPDQGVTTDAMLFGDCVIVEGIKKA